MALREPMLPSDGWGCGGPAGCIDVKRWFIGVITPDFNTAEARERCVSVDEVDESVVHAKPPRLAEATRTIMRSCEELNRDVSFKDARGLMARCCAPLEPDSVRSCSSALAATALGAGALALPYAFSLTGIGLGLLTLTLAGLVSSLSLQILMVAARYTNTRSYSAVLELSVGSRVASLALDLVVLFNGVGSVICILIFEGDFVPAVLAKPPGFEGIGIERYVAVVGAALAAWPLTLSANISALRYVAVAVPVALLATILIVLYDVPELHRELRSAGDRVMWWHFEPRKWLQAVVIMINAFANHMNAIPCVNQLGKPSISRIVKATVNGNLLVWALLSALGVGGYVSWASATKGDFLLNYPEGRPEIWFCRLMLALIVYLVLPVALLPTAKSGAQLLLAAAGASRGEVGPRVHRLSATLLLTFCTFIAAKVSNVASVIGLLGGLLASSLMFWFPAVVYRLLLWPTQPHIFRGPVLSSIVLFGSLGWASVAINYL